MNNNYIPNTASIPNILFDYWMNRLSPAEFKVLMCIARKTYGFNKGVDRISIGQIEKMTGLSRKGITKNIESLISYGLVNKLKSKTIDGDDAPNQFEINIFCKDLSDENCMGVGSELSSLGGSELSTLGVVNSVHPQNTTYKTQQIQNTPPIPPQSFESPPDLPKRATLSCPNGQMVSPKGEMPAKAGEKNSLKVPKIKKIKGEFSEAVRDVGEKLLGVLLRNKPTFVHPKNLTPFLTEVDFILRLDRRDPQLVIDVFSWAVADSFWGPNMFKPNPAKYLREKFDQLEQKMKAKPPNDPKKVDRRYRDMNGNTTDDWKSRLF